MRQEILLNDGWRFHKGDIFVNRPTDKDPVYSQSKVERKKIGPVAYHYHDIPDDYTNTQEIRCSGWKTVNLPHDYILNQDNDPTQNNEHGYFHYDNAWYRKHFSLPHGFEDKRVLLRFDGIASQSILYLNGGRRRDKDADTSNHFQSREKTWKFLMSRPYVIGGYQWAAVEHRGEATWPAVCSKSGALDLFLQKKGAFYQNLSHWSETPMAHIVPHWNFSGLENREIPVTVYTNCDELELFLNGESLGRKAIEPYGHGEWNVVYIPGTLEVKGYRSGEFVASHSRTTTGKPVRLRLTQDIPCANNGRDIALFTCQCLDAHGNEVPDAAEFVRFSVEEPAKILGTGADHCDHNNVTLPERKMYMGKIRIAVQPAPGQTYLTLTAIGDTCGCTSICIELQKA